MHRYNNSDHSMLTAMRADDHGLEGTAHDLWAINAESAYHESDVPEQHPYRGLPGAHPLIGSPDSSAA